MKSSSSNKKKATASGKKNRVSPILKTVAKAASIRTEEPLVKSANLFPGVMVVASDVTDQVLAHKQIEASKQHLQGRFYLRKSDDSE